jgi:hypothetical protein
MNRKERMGLVGAGSLRGSWIARVPSLLRHLGPVKCASYPAARKLVAALRSGYAVAEYAPLEACAAIFVAVPESRLDLVITQLAQQPWIRGAQVVLCSSVRDSWSAKLLRARGARIGSLNPMEETRPGLFVAEGHRDVLILLRRILDDEQKLIEIRTGAKPAYLAGLHLATDLLRPWVDASMECLRSAGFSRAEAAELTDALSVRSLRAQLKTGSKARAAPLKAELRRALKSDVELLRSADPRRAELYAAGIRHVLEYFEFRKEARAAGNG